MSRPISEQSRSGQALSGSQFFECAVPRVMALFAYSLLFLMLFLPTTYPQLKGTVLAIVLIAIGTKIMVTGRLKVHSAIVNWTLLLVSVGLFFMWCGSLSGAPGAMRVGTVYVVWPIVYLIFLAGLSDKSLVEGIFRVLVFSTILIALYTASFLLSIVGLLPDYLYIELELGQAIGIYDGFVEFNLYSISSLIFLVPFLIACVLAWPKTGVPVSRFWIWTACFFGIGAAILSGRRALWLVVALSPVLVFLGRYAMSRNYRVGNRGSFVRSLGVLSVVAIVAMTLLDRLFELDVGAILANFLAGFDFFAVSGAESATIRSEQFVGLLEGWQRHPLFGAGHGAALPGLVRSEEMPWAFELSYMALLYHTGTIGFLLYASGVLWIFCMGVRIMRSGHWIGLYMLPTLVGTFSFLVANATNPYMAKYDYLWVLFLPVGLINRWLLDRRKDDGRRVARSLASQRG